MKFFQRIWAIAGNTFTELVRMKVFYFLLIFGFLLTGASLLSVNFSFAEEFQMMRDVGLGAISLFTSLLAIAGTSILLPKEIEDRTLYTILAKPVPRHEYLLGKWLGACFLIGLALVLMAALFFALVYFRLEARSAELVGQLQGEDLEAAKANLRSDVLNVGYVPGLLMIYIRACLVASFTLLISTIATSSLFTLICAFMVFLIGHIQAVAREAMERYQSISQGWLQDTFMGLVVLIFPDLQMFDLVDELVAGVDIAWDVVYGTGLLGIAYITVYTVMACLFFTFKEL